MDFNKIMKTIFAYAIAFAICFLVVFNISAIWSTIQESNITNTGGSSQSSSTESVTSVIQSIVENATSEQTTSEARREYTSGVFVTGTYRHELGEYGFGVAELVPTITFNEDGTFEMRENSDSYMAQITGNYTVSADGQIITCNVEVSDIVIPDQIIFIVDGNFIVLETDLKASIVDAGFLIIE